jgi:magnesium-transporting ATPase (P-type)
MVALTIVFLGGATLGQSPFNVIQLLWINMVMDTLAALSLATEPPHPTELKKERVKKHDRIIQKVMWRSIMGQYVYQMLVLITLLYFGPMMFEGRNYDYYNTPFYTEILINGVNTMVVTNKTYHYTLVFHTFMLMNLFNQINSRKLGLKDFNIFERFFNNFWFLVVLAGEFVAQFFIVELGGIIFRTAPLPWDMQICAISFGVGSLIIGAALKATPPEWVEKIPVIINEEATEEGNDLLSKVHKRVQGKYQKSETERLLDSQ